MKKRLFKNLFFVMVMAVLCMAVAVTANAKTTNDGFTYTISNGEATITGYEGDPSMDLNIPAEIDGCPVTEIGTQAFFQRSDLTGNLLIPDGVTSIGSSTFSGCSGLTGDLIIPDSVTNIEPQAFYGCKGFNGKLIIPASVTSISSYAFNSCSGFTGDLIIPDGVTSIGFNAFEGCSVFDGKLVIPNTVESIGFYAFDNCSGFTGDLIIPDSVISISSSAFDSCSGFTGSLIIPRSVTSIDRYAFSGCSGFDELIISDDVTEIGHAAFSFCNFSHIGYASDETEWNNIIDKTYGVGFSNDKIHFSFNPETDITENITPSTCLVNGSKETVCSCGYSYGTETLLLAECSFTAYEADNNADCLNDGTKTAYCDYNCKNSNTVKIEGSALGHNLGEFVTIQEATCTVNGLATAACSRCDYSESKEIIANNHKDENLDGSCDYCNEYLADADCLCVCHAKTIGAFIYKLFKAIDKIFKTNLVEKIFGITDICACGIKH